MKSKKQELEKRIFVLFFVITFIIVLILIFVEQELAKYGINQYEDLNIGLSLSELNISRTEIKKRQQSLLQDLEIDTIVIEALQKDNKNLIKKHLTKNYQSENIDRLIICNKQRKYIFGVQWELIDKYLPQIYQDIATEHSGDFIGNFGDRLFQITYNPVFSSTETKELLGVMIIVDNFDIYSLKLVSKSNVSLTSYNKTLSESDVPKDFTSFISKINDIIESMIKEKNEQKIKRLSSKHAAGVIIYYDLTDEPSGIFIISYNRYVNQFMQQSILIFVLILLAVTLIMISLLGNWFSKAILIPVRSISNKMHDIANNPSIVEPIEEKYSGVLGDMVSSFSTMNIALSTYGQTLMEYKELTDNLDTGIFWLNNKFEVILFNSSLLEILESDKYIILNKNLSRLMGLNKKHFDKLDETPLTFSNLEIYPNKQKKNVALNIRAVKNDSGTKFVGSILDISKEVLETEARKSLELELIKSNKLADIGKRIEGIVHNINSPLNTILGYAQLLKRDLKDNNDLERIIEAGKNIAHTIKGLLTKVKQSNISIDRPVNINEMTSRELEFCKHNLFFKHYIELATDFQKDLPNVTASYGDLSLCVANIINNAIHAMKDSKLKILTIRTYEKDKMIYLEITDTGEGIAGYNLKKIFETYFSTKMGKAGTGFGLGLAITKNIIDKYDGEIKVISKLNSGTTFTIILPQTRG